jgi:hypothetical protein
VSPGSDGIRVRSANRSDALKTVVWAATNARKKPRLKPEFIFV